MRIVSPAYIWIRASDEFYCIFASFLVDFTRWHIKLFNAFLQFLREIVNINLYIKMLKEYLV